MVEAGRIEPLVKSRRCFITYVWQLFKIRGGWCQRERIQTLHLFVSASPVSLWTPERSFRGESTANFSQRNPFNSFPAQVLLKFSFQWKLLPPGMTSASLNKGAVMRAAPLHQASRTAGGRAQSHCDWRYSFLTRSLRNWGKHMGQNIMSIYESNSNGWLMARALAPSIKT